MKYCANRCEDAGKWQIWIKGLSSTCFDWFKCGSKNGGCDNVAPGNVQADGYWFYLIVNKTATTTSSFNFSATYTYMVGVDTTKVIGFPVITFSPACPNAYRRVSSTPALPACATWDDTGLTLTDCDTTVLGNYAV
jgi:hypothetical protein